MAVNEEYEGQQQGRGIGRFSSQAGLSTYARGRIASPPSAPAPAPVPRISKSLPLKTSPDMIRRVPAAVMNPGSKKDEESEQTVTGAAAKGFVGGFVGGAQNRMFGAASGGAGQEGANPSWQKNNREAVALNTKIMAATAESITLMDQDIRTMTDPADVALRVQLIAARARALEGFRTMQLSMAHDQVNEDVQSGAHTEADVQALREILDQLQSANDRMRTNQQQPVAAEPRTRSRNRTAPVRNADGKSLADLMAPAPGEEPLPGTSHPLLVDALNAVQGVPPRRAAQGSGRGVVMNPAHVAGLASLENGRDDSLENDSYFGR